MTKKLLERSGEFDLKYSLWSEIYALSVQLITGKDFLRVVLTNFLHTGRQDYCFSNSDFCNFEFFQKMKVSTYI